MSESHRPWRCTQSSVGRTRPRGLRGLGLALASLALPIAAVATPLPPLPADEAWAQVEIPAGQFTKYEIDPASGRLIVDRFQTMPVAYPANYGSLPATQGADGDPLDVLVLTREPVVPGAFMRVRPIGVLMMRDGGEADEKIIAVPADKVDPDYRDIRNIDDLPAAQRDRIEAFFRVYKQLPAGRKVVELDGYRNRKAALEMIRSGTKNPKPAP